METDARLSDFFAACQELFEQYPLAIDWAAWNEPPPSSVVREITLEWWDGEVSRGYYVVSHRILEDDRDAYTMATWGADDGTLAVTEDGTSGAFMRGNEPPAPECTNDFLHSLPEFIQALRDGFPMPRTDSIFGYIERKVVTAIVGAFIRPDDEPGWSIHRSPNAMPPDFDSPTTTGTEDQLRLFWNHVQAGRVILLDPLIAENPGTVWWVEVEDNDTVIMVSDSVPPLAPGVYGTYLFTSPPSFEVVMSSEKLDLAEGMSNLLEEIEWFMTAHKERVAPLTNSRSQVALG